MIIFKVLFYFAVDDLLLDLVHNSYVRLPLTVLIVNCLSRCILPTYCIYISSRHILKGIEENNLDSNEIFHKNYITKVNMNDLIRGERQQFRTNCKYLRLVDHLEKYIITVEHVPNCVA